MGCHPFPLSRKSGEGFVNQVGRGSAGQHRTYLFSILPLHFGTKPKVQHLRAARQEFVERLPRTRMARGPQGTKAEGGLIWGYARSSLTRPTAVFVHLYLVDMHPGKCLRREKAEDLDTTQAKQTARRAPPRNAVIQRHGAHWGEWAWAVQPSLPVEASSEGERWGGSHVPRD